MRTRATTSGSKSLFGGSFSLRLSLYILLITTAIFVVAIVVTYRTARQQVQREVVGRAQVAVDNTILSISTILGGVEATLESAAVLVEDSDHDADAMYDITKHVIANNPDIVGSAIAFKPHHFSNKGLYFAPYTYRAGEAIASKQLGNDSYNYFDMEWYSVPSTYGLPYWSEPYFDHGGADRMLATYSYPLRDDEGEVYAIMTADISIEQFAEAVKAIKPYDGAYNFMLSRRGAFLAHSRHEALLTETVFDNAVRFNEPELAELANKMVGLERGVCVYTRDGVEYYVLYAPVASTGWSVAVACPYINIFSSVYSLRDNIATIFIVGIILLVSLCYIAIRRLTRPLKRLTLSAREIAAGHFDSATPEVRGRDEMRQLRDAFENMRTSLIAYIDELRTTTAHKERMASDLRVARDIQLGLLPKDESVAKHGASVALASRLIPAKEVGGDLYNFFVKDDKLYFIVGDVSGKGVPAALVMAVVCRMFRTVASATGSPAEIISVLNRVLAENNDSNMFCTAFVGILDIASGALRYANAGHNPIILYGRDAEPRELMAETNIPLGVIEEYTFIGGECHIERGTHIMAYTDGVTEAANNRDELFGIKRLMNILDRYRESRPDEVVATLVEILSEYSRDCEQSDDIAILDIELKR